MKKEDRNLFNGTLLNFIRVSKKKNKIKILANFIEYKHFLAQRMRPNLRLGIKPIGVSGIMVLEEKGISYIVFAKRAKNVTEYPGFFELIPSGSIDEKCLSANGIINFQAKLLLELMEETGLSKSYVKHIFGFAFILDTNHNVYDICCKIFLKAKKELVVGNFIKSKEYSEPVFIPVDDLDLFIKKNVFKIVPTSVAIARAYNS